MYHEGTRQNVFRVMAFINAYMTEMDNLESITGNMQHHRPSSWQPPKRDGVEIKFDACFHNQSNKSVSGVLIRKNERLILVVCTYPNENMMDATIAHSPGKEGRRYESPMYWIEEAPARVEELVDLNRCRLNRRRWKEMLESEGTENMKASGNSSRKGGKDLIKTKFTLLREVGKDLLLLS
ncbi:hypothetical protein Goshw_009986 [Gossypium schwendimanii]|uniref:Uncharacterized protein n=1 Tax=Gossypium schwendimanii TaxID=34291 RepID=A0A7J9KWY0_GOSSC|nr:hypothetical protein [Gossypium schwendimanii]